MSERIANVWRGEMVESSHDGDAVVVDTHGNVLWSLGNPERMIYARSSAKPLQALPLIETGAADAFSLTEEELAVTCASHNGEPYHTNLVAGILKKIGMSENDLQCGVHAPYHTPSYEALLRQNIELGPLQNNCSGKHAGMLVLCAHLGADKGTYLSRQHPVQRAIRGAIASICEFPEEEIVPGTDGCGVPVFGLPLEKLALGFAHLANPVDLPDTRQDALNRIRNAMLHYPYAIAGEDRFCTDLMVAGRGRIVGKTGAEAVYALGLPEPGWGLCLKVSDGNSRAIPPVVVDMLQQIQAVPDEVIANLAKHHFPEMRNHQGTLVGRIESVARLKSSK